MTTREALANVVAMLDRDAGAFRSPKDQGVVSDARTALVSHESRSLWTYMRCDTAECPSRLELPGEISARAAAFAAKQLGWEANDQAHRCPACRVVKGDLPWG